MDDGKLCMCMTAWGRLLQMVACQCGGVSGCLSYLCQIEVEVGSSARTCIVTLFNEYSERVIWEVKPTGIFWWCRICIDGAK